MKALRHPTRLLLLLVWRYLFRCCPVSLVLLCLRLSFISTVSGLTCVQCVSVETTKCLYGQLTPTPCAGDDTGSTYCLKSLGTQISGHGHFVFRTCSKTLQTNCTQAPIEGDMYTICHYSCVEDGCNRATSASISSLAVLLVCIFVGL